MRLLHLFILVMMERISYQDQEIKKLKFGKVRQEKKYNVLQDIMIRLLRFNLVQILNL